MLISIYRLRSIDRGVDSYCSNLALVMGEITLIFSLLLAMLYR